MTDLKLFFDIDNTNIVIRGTQDANGLDFWSVHDFINAVCNKKNTYGKNTYYRLISEGSKYKHEIKSLCHHHKVAGTLIILLYVNSY